MPLGHVSAKGNVGKRQAKAKAKAKAKANTKQRQRQKKQTMTTKDVQPAPEEAKPYSMEGLLAMVKSLQEEIEILKEARKEVITPPSPPPSAYSA